MDRHAVTSGSREGKSYSVVNSSKQTQPQNKRKRFLKSGSFLRSGYASWWDVLDICVMKLHLGRETGWELNVSWMVAKENWRSLQDQFDSERCPLSLNMYVNAKEAWKYGYIIWNYFWEGSINEPEDVQTLLNDTFERFKHVSRLCVISSAHLLFLFSVQYILVRIWHLLHVSLCNNTLSWHEVQHQGGLQQVNKGLC